MGVKGCINVGILCRIGVETGELYYYCIDYYAFASTFSPPPNQIELHTPMLNRVMLVGLTEGMYIHIWKYEIDY